MTAQAIPAETAHRIRRAYMTSRCSLDTLAKRFSVSRYTAWKVVSGTHKHTEGLPAVTRLRGPGSSRIELADIRVTIPAVDRIHLACPCGQWSYMARLGGTTALEEVTDPALRHLVADHWSKQ